MSELSAHVKIEDMTNFSGGRAEGVVVLETNISPAIFSRVHPLEQSAIDRTTLALENNGRHELDIEFSKLRLALPKTLKGKYSIAATGRSDSEPGIECEVMPDLRDSMTIHLRVDQMVGMNKPNFGRLSIRIKAKFVIPEASPSIQLLDLFKAWQGR